jgi:hypothetical protein
MAPLSGVLEKLEAKTNKSAEIILAGAHSFVSLLLILAMALPWVSISSSVSISGNVVYSDSFSLNLFRGGQDGAGAMLVLSFIGVLVITGVFVHSTAVEPIDAKYHKALVLVSGLATGFLLLSFIIAIATAPSFTSTPAVKVTNFGAGTFFALLALPLQVALGLMLHDFASRSAGGAAPSTAVATPVPGPAAGQSPAGAKV